MTSLTAMSGVLAQEAAHVRARDGDRLDRVERLDRRRAPFGVEHGQLAEDVAGAEVRERDRAPVDVLAHGARVAAADDVAGVALVALAEDDLLRVEAPRHRDLRDPAQVLGPERLEHGHGAQQRDAVLQPRHGRQSLSAPAWPARPLGVRPRHASRDRLGAGQARLAAVTPRRRARWRPRPSRPFVHDRPQGADHRGGIGVLDDVAAVDDPGRALLDERVRPLEHLRVADAAPAARARGPRRR
jgi:hypothetical protein